MEFVNNLIFLYRRRMFFRAALRYLCIASCLLCSACLFGPHKGPRVMGYRHGTVFLSHDGGYRVGLLPGGWRRLRTGARAATFHHEATGATISTSALCGAAYEDLPLSVLMGHLFSGFATERIVTTRAVPLAGREALRQVSVRTVDGVGLQFDAVVIKKHRCTFDFVCMAPPPAYPQVVAAFESFYGAFAYE